MKRSKFSEEQIVAILREQEAGAKTEDVSRRHGISSAPEKSCRSSPPTVLAVFRAARGVDVMFPSN